MDALIPWLYLRGVSTGAFTDALSALLGAEAPGLSAATVSRLKAKGEAEHEEWRNRGLDRKRYVDMWADGVYCNPRKDDARLGLLVLIRATENSKKELSAEEEGDRESEQSLRELMLRLKSQGWSYEPKLAIGAGALGF